jgi:hypothetical protein
MIEKPDRLVDHVPGTITGSHQQIHVDYILEPRDGVGMFFANVDNMLGVGLQLEDEHFGRLLIQLNAANAVGLYRLLEQFVTMDDFTLDRFIARVSNPGEAN